MENCAETCGYCGCGSDAGSFDECFERRRRPTQEMNCGSDGAKQNCGKTCGYNKCRRNLGGCSDQADYDTCYAAKFQPLFPSTEHHCGAETWVVAQTKPIMTRATQQNFNLCFQAPNTIAETKLGLCRTVNKPVDTADVAVMREVLTNASNAEDILLKK